jgi:hypothetical protein
MVNDDDELTTFKTGIDLRRYLSDRGYEIDHCRSTLTEMYMRSQDDKVNVGRKPNKEWVWYSFLDKTGGTILNFLALRQDISNLGERRKYLRRWMALHPDPWQVPPPVDPPEKDLAAVRSQCAGLAIVRRHPYLENERRIPRHIIDSSRFYGSIRSNRYGNAVFLHRGADGKASGWEARGRDFKGFCAGGIKGLWQSKRLPNDDRLVFAESGINCLSYAALYPNPHTRFASTAGTPSRRQQQLIGAAIAAMPAGSYIIAAMDADRPGRQHADSIREIFRSLSRSDLEFREHYPLEGTDWNDLLRRGLTPPVGA